MSETPVQDLTTGFYTAPFDDSASHTAQVVAAYLSKVPVSQADLQALIRDTHTTFSGLGKPPVPAQSIEDIDCRQTPEAIAASITPDALISFIDGSSLKTLRRHLTTNGMDAESYRAKFGLPATYPMVCESYSAQRSELAKQLGLGQQRRKREPADASLAA